MHRVVVVAVPPVGTFELSLPDLMFGGTRVDGCPAYDVLTCTAEPGRVASTSGLDVFVSHGLDALDDAQTIIVSGTGAREHADQRVLAALRRSASRGARIASICTGAFVLAQAGLLDGRHATTHWQYATELAERFPGVTLQPDVLFVEDGGVVTSAGLAAGIDLCLHLIRTDYGASVANTVARLAIVAPVRPGGQAQFITSPMPTKSGTSLSDTRVWALSRLHEPLTLTDLAAHAHTSIRTLTRRFRAETGLSPLQWLLQQRVERARELLESTDLPMGQVAYRSGIGTVDSLRQLVVRNTGLTPTAYRASFTRSP
ncbi:transcriptional regulator, AraC family [Parafrankia sp. EAN1pec]|uniref:GlxA family transcriptional regulator n=1 Tax=Parafrankia sp. (strain EAN1pec) TaxID=298653 RepID=UPI00005432DF|nr:transcriptional regulator, AraC family [Frankia sp. EAN1pec]